MEAHDETTLSSGFEYCRVGQRWLRGYSGGFENLCGAGLFWYDGDYGNYGTKYRGRACSSGIDAGDFACADGCRVVGYRRGCGENRYAAQSGNRAGGCRCFAPI